jgi:hypothetical protein
MLRPAAALLPVALLALACGDSPQLNVEQKPASTAPAPAAQPATAAPAAAPTGEPPLVAGHASAAPAELPPGHPPISGMPGGAQVPVVPAGTGEGASALAWTAAKDWISEPPANPMRRAQYRVPGPGGDGECAVFYFGPGQGGNPQANAERWAGQFVQPDGKPPLAAMTTRTETVGGASVLFVETTGTYMSGGMMGDAPVAKEGWALLGAVVPGPDADWFFKFTGPAKTVAAQKAAFEAMIASTKHGG